MMMKRIKIGLLIAVMMSLVFTVSCAKKTPGPDQQVATGQQAEGVTPEDRAAGEKGAISEEELEARRAARQRAEEQAKAEAEKSAFVNTEVFFAFDDATLSAQAQEKLKNQARWLLANTGPTVIIEGHCDERGTDEYNLALGSRRAESVKDFLVNLGVSPSRLVTISYGEERPAVQGTGEEAWTKNRRAEFRIR